MISRLMSALQMDSKLPSLANAVNWKPYMNRKLIHWQVRMIIATTLQQPLLTFYDATKNSNCIFIHHTRIASAAIFLILWVMCRGGRKRFICRLKVFS